MPTLSGARQLNARNHVVSAKLESLAVVKLKATVKTLLLHASQPVVSNGVDFLLLFWGDHLVYESKMINALLFYLYKYNKLSVFRHVFFI